MRDRPAALAGNTTIPQAYRQARAPPGGPGCTNEIRSRRSSKPDTAERTKASRNHLKRGPARRSRIAGKSDHQIEWISDEERGNHRQRRRHAECLLRAHTEPPAAANAAQPIPKAARNPPGDLFIALILASVTFRPCVCAAVSISTEILRQPCQTGRASRDRNRGRAQRIHVPPDGDARRTRFERRHPRQTTAKCATVIFSPKHERTEETYRQAPQRTEESDSHR